MNSDLSFFFISEFDVCLFYYVSPIATMLEAFLFAPSFLQTVAKEFLKSEVKQPLHTRLSLLPSFIYFQGNCLCFLIALLFTFVKLFVMLLYFFVDDIFRHCFSQPLFSIILLVSFLFIKQARMAFIHQSSYRMTNRTHGDKGFPFLALFLKIPDLLQRSNEHRNWTGKPWHHLKRKIWPFFLHV